MPDGEDGRFEKPRSAAEDGYFRAIVGSLSGAAGAGPGVDPRAGKGGIVPGG